MSPDFYAWVRAQAAELGADGCTWVSEAYHECCLLHDIAYRTGLDPLWLYRGVEVLITRRAADRLLRDCIQLNSPLGKWSPMSWVRWAGVRLFGRWAWKGTNYEPLGYEVRVKGKR